MMFSVNSYFYFNFSFIIHNIYNDFYIKQKLKNVLAIVQYII